MLLLKMLPHVLRPKSWGDILTSTSAQVTPRAGLNSSEARLNKPEPEGFLALAGQVDALVSRPADQVLGLHVKLCRANQGLE